MQAPNGMGTLLGLAQLLLYATFYRSTKRMTEERKAKGELGLTEKVEAHNNGYANDV